MDIVTYALCKKQIQSALEGAGALKGDKGDPFRYEDFTPEQLEALKGDNYIITEADYQQIASYVEAEADEPISLEQIKSLFIAKENE